MKRAKYLYGSASRIVRFKKLFIQQGEYAIALYHDKNNNAVCDSNFFGIPTEGFGFSNNVRPFLSAPSFRKAKINLVEDTTIFIWLIYM
jgi:uncharacterized protein (DUF2141 family)